MINIFSQYARSLYFEKTLHSKVQLFVKNHGQKNIFNGLGTHFVFPYHSKTQSVFSTSCLHGMIPWRHDIKSILNFLNKGISGLMTAGHSLEKQLFWFCPVLCAYIDSVGIVISSAHFIAAIHQSLKILTKYLHIAHFSRTKSSYVQIVRLLLILTPASYLRAAWSSLLHTHAGSMWEGRQTGIPVASTDRTQFKKVQHNFGSKWKSIELEIFLEREKQDVLQFSN